MEPWSQATVSLIERGERQTIYDVRTLLMFADAVGMPRTALLPVILGCAGPAKGTDKEAASPGADAMDRREFELMAAGLFLSPMLPAGAAPERVDSAHIRYLRATAERLRSQDQHTGGAAVLPEALHHFTKARQMLDESDYTSKIGRELLSITAELGEISGWLAYDSGKQRLTRHLYSEAALLAGNAEDSQLSVHLYANMAQQSIHLARTTGRTGHVREALRFTERASVIARHEPSPRLHALIAMRQALAYAHVGDEIAFRASITTARRDLDRGPHETDPAWTHFITESEIRGYEAMGAEQLGNPEKAITLCQDALTDPGRSRRDHAYYHGRLAGLLLKAGDRSEAIKHASYVLPALAENLTSVRTLNELKPVRAAAAQANDEEFCSRFDTAARTLTA